MAFNINISGFLKNIFSRKNAAEDVIGKRIENSTPKALRNPTALHGSSNAQYLEPPIEPVSWKQATEGLDGGASKIKPKPTDNEEMVREIGERPLYSSKSNSDDVRSFQDFIRGYGGRDSHTPRQQAELHADHFAQYTGDVERMQRTAQLHHEEMARTEQDTLWQDFINGQKLHPQRHHEHDHDIER